MINKDRIIKTFCEIVAIDSPSGEEESMAIDVQRFELVEKVRIEIQTF